MAKAYSLSNWIAFACLSWNCSVVSNSPFTLAAFSRRMRGSISSVFGMVAGMALDFAGGFVALRAGVWASKMLAAMIRSENVRIGEFLFAPQSYPSDWPKGSPERRRLQPPVLRHKPTGCLSVIPDGYPL